MAPSTPSSQKRPPETRMASPEILSALRDGAVAVVEPARQVLRVRGPDAKSWLNGVITCDVGRLAEGEGAHGLLLSKQGKIQAELDVIAAKDGLLLGVQAVEPDVPALLDRYLIMEDAELTPEPELAWIRLHGAGAGRAAANIAASVAVGAIDWLGVGGRAVAVTKSELTRSLDESSATVLDVAGSEWAFLRMAYGFPSFGREYAEESNPHEAALERRAVSWSKGCYLGQEVVCMQDMRGKVKRRLAPLWVAGDDAVPSGAEVTSGDGGAAAGSIVTSASDAGVTLAFARLVAPFFESNLALSVGGRRARIVTPKALEDGTFSD